MKLSVNDQVSWKPHPEIKSTIVAIKTYRNGGNRIRYYKLKNGQWLTEDEIIKTEHVKTVKK